MLVFQAGEARGELPIEDELADRLVLPGAGGIEAGWFGEPMWGRKGRKEHEVIAKEWAATGKGREAGGDGETAHTQRELST